MFTVKHRQYLIAPVFISLILAFACSSQAQSSISTDPIYVIDMQRVFSESVMGKAAGNDLQAEIKKKTLSLEKLKMELDNIKDDLEKQSTLLSQDALLVKEEQYLKKQREFERAYQDQREELAIKNRDSMEKVLKKINQVIADLAKKNDYKIIMEKDLRVVVYANSKYDISDQVIKELDHIHTGM